MDKVKKACDCKTIEEIRKQIDTIDLELIQLFAKRYEYVKEIVKFKEKSVDAIIAEERKQQVIGQRSKWAEESGLDRDTYARIFTELIDHNISKELEIFKETNK